MAKSSTLPALSALNEFVKGNNFEEAGIVLEVVKDCRILADVQFLCSHCGEIATSAGLSLAHSSCSQHLLYTAKYYTEACKKVSRTATSCPLCAEKPLRRLRILP